MPTMITAPNTGSFFVPMISSKLFGIGDHLLHGHADDRRRRAASPWPASIIRSKAARTCVVGGQVQHHAAHVGLVRDLRRVDLHHHRIAEPVRHFDRLVGRAGGLRLGDRNLVGFQERLRDVLREDLVALRSGSCRTRRAAAAVERELHRDVARRFVQDLQVAGVGDQVHERAHRLFRRVVGGDARRR